MKTAKQCRFHFIIVILIFDFDFYILVKNYQNFKLPKMRPLGFEREW